MPSFAPAGLDEWNVAAVDLDAYFARIDHARVDATVAGLMSLHEAHVRAIPFENIDVITDSDGGLDLSVIQRKILFRRRGGYCFEHSLLFGAVLERLGFEVSRRLARVTPEKNGPFTHMLLVVTLDGNDYLADVGFGATILHPMPLRERVVVDQAGWEYRLTRRARSWQLERNKAGSWIPQHRFDDARWHLADCVVSHHYLATHHDSPFVGRPLVLQVNSDVRRRLTGTRLTEERTDGKTTTRTIEPGELVPTLQELGLDLTAAECEELGRRFPAIPPDRGTDDEEYR